MRRLLVGSAVLAAVATFATPGRAQVFPNNTVPGGDPFFLYYGFFLPRQAMLSLQPRPQDTVNALSAARQFSAQTERAGLYDPVSPFGADLYDPSRPFAGRATGRSRRPLPMTGVTGTNINGMGPAAYYSRTNGYYPSLRVGRSTNIGAGYSRGGFGAGVSGSMYSNMASGMRPR